MMEDTLKPGQRLIATVDGKKTKLVFSLETEEKGDRRDHCFRLDAPHFPIIPKESKVVPIKLQEMEWKSVPSAK
jgi:hypothetical protein